MDWVKSTLRQSMAFGTIESRKSFMSFMIKIFIFLIPAVVLGHLIDEVMNDVYRLCNKESCECGVLLLNLILMIIIVYLFFLFFQNFASEFQTTAAGGFFIALFFGFQPYFMDHLKDHMRHMFYGINA